ncbi:MAG TPA: phage head-tail connector protein [Clostridia bacterium]|nr:phage head-tail connector protein [Clostridia bacterium]
MLEIVKMLLGIDATDTLKDELLNHFISQALMAGLSYCNVTSLSIEYNGTIADLAVYLYKNKDSVGYSQKTEGERGITFESGGGAIPENIKLSLPLPRIKVGASDV